MIFEMIHLLIIVVGCVGAVATTCPATAGFYCPVGATEQVACPAGSAVFAEGLTTEEACLGQQVFAYTGGLQSYTIPAGVTAIVAHVWGAGGGGGKKHFAHVIVFLSVTKTRMLTLASILFTIELIPIIDPYPVFWNHDPFDTPYTGHWSLIAPIIPFPGGVLKFDVFIILILTLTR